MPVVVAKSAGFCMGVNRAVNTALDVAKTAAQQGKKAYSLGELIHNPAVVDMLASEGLHAISSPEEGQDGILVIRSHGASPQLISEAAAHAEKIVDCTCPFVHHVHKLVDAHSKDGAPVIILGDPDHPEIRGIIGWCRGETFVIQREEQVDELPDSAADALLVSQTTFPPPLFDRLLRMLLARFPSLRYENTICKATSVRQAEAEALAKSSDVMIVIGGRHSANTRKLAETCAKWCPRTYLVEGVDQLRGIPFDPAHENIGITAGASTPAWSLKEVVDFMNDKELNGQNLNPETPEQLDKAQETAAEVVEDITEVAEEQAQAVAEAAEEAVEQAETVAEEAEQAVEEAAAAAEEAVEAVTEEAAEEPVAEEVQESPAEEAPEATEETPEAAEETPEAPAAEEEAPKPEPSFMDEVAASMSRIRTGQTITGKVVLITDDEVCVNIDYKSDGLLKRDEMVDEDVQLGDEIEVEVVKVNDGEGNVILSQRNIVNRKVWAALMEKYEAGELVDAVGREAVKGGLLANIDGVRAFIPASHLAQRYVEKISQFVGQEMQLKIIEVDESKKRVVASRKEALAIQNAAIKEAVWSTLEEGAVVKGIVRRFTNFGAFVDLGGVDGLIHVSDLSWSRSVNPSDVLTANEEIEVKILSLDRERDRIALGYKQLQPRPWDNVEEKYPVGSILTRKIVRIRPFGAFIELEPGVDGLVHISQVAPTRIERIEDVIQPGQEVDVKVLAVDPDAKRISLSIREALPVSAAFEQYQDSAPAYSQDEADYSPVATKEPATFEAPAPVADEPRVETALELAMRKAREELEAKEAEAGVEAEVEVAAETEVEPEVEAETEVEPEAEADADKE